MYLTVLEEELFPKAHLALKEAWKVYKHIKISAKPTARLVNLGGPWAIIFHQVMLEPWKLKRVR